MSRFQKASDWFDGLFGTMRTSFKDRLLKLFRRGQEFAQRNACVVGASNVFQVEFFDVRIVQSGGTSAYTRFTQRLVAQVEHPYGCAFQGTGDDFQHFERFSLMPSRDDVADVYLFQRPSVILERTCDDPG
eukprot:jgi/Pico_ML_1/52366/g3078.t1